MTRWTIYLVLKDKVLYTTEFNWDMYEDWHGDYVMQQLALIKDEDWFRFFVKKFNTDNFWYEEQLVYDMDPDEFYDTLDMSKNYFDNWFSDYIFIKNISDDTIEVATGDWAIVEILPQDEARFNFWDRVDKDEYNILESEDEKEESSTVVVDHMWFGELWIVRAIDWTTQKKHIYVWVGRWDNLADDLNHIKNLWTKYTGDRVKSLINFLSRWLDDEDWKETKD